MKIRKEIIGNCTLYLGDCREIIPTIGKIDAIVSDPPYGINLCADFSSMNYKFKFKGSKGGKKYDSIIGDDNFFNPSHLLNTADQFALFGGEYYISQLPVGGSLSIWDKRLSESADKMFGSCYETIWFFPARKKDIIRHKWAGFFGTEKEDIKKRVHPAQKPYQLIKKVILCLRKSPFTICDPYMGSGSTGVACVELERNFIGIEINEGYFDIACKRIEEAVNTRQNELFREAS